MNIGKGDVMSMDRFNLVTRLCDLCDIAENYSPYSGNFTSEDKSEFMMVFKEIDSPGLVCQHFVDMLVCFGSDGNVQLYLSDAY